MSTKANELKAKHGRYHLETLHTLYSGLDNEYNEVVVVIDPKPLKEQEQAVDDINTVIGLPLRHLTF